MNHTEFQTPCRCVAKLRNDVAESCTHSSEALLHACVMFRAPDHPPHTCQATSQTFTASAVLLLGHHHHVYVPDKLIAKHNTFGMSPWPVV